jgi:hypothetical protein
VINGRIYGGMHYRFSGDAGALIARQVANYVARHDFRTVKGRGHNGNPDESDDDEHDER